MSDDSFASTLPIIDLSPYLDAAGSAAAAAQCALAAEALITHGALLVRDRRVPPAANSAFLDLLEDYFAQPAEVLRRDERPEVGYQVGVTLENTERPRCAVHAPCLATISRLAESERPLDVLGHQPDPKCRFFWRVGERPPGPSEFPQHNVENVVPQAAGLGERWPAVMDGWGGAMRAAVETVAEMAAVGMGLPAATFRAAGAYGAHLLAPTASDLDRHGARDTVLAGFHTDLNFLTIHGRSRYPGLHIWARNTGRKMAVRMPAGADYLLVQAGKQLEHVTGGLVRAGYHEVAVTEDTVRAVERRRRERPDRPLIRISSTFFWHLESDYTMRPVPALAARAREMCLRTGEEPGGYDGGDGYPVMKVGELVQNELKHIDLMA